MGEEAGRNSIPNNAALDPSLQTYWSLQWKLPMHSPLPDSRCGWVESRSPAPPMGRSFPSISDPQHPSRKVSKHLVRLRLFYPWFHPPNPYRMILLISDSPEGPLRGSVCGHSRGILSCSHPALLLQLHRVKWPKTNFCLSFPAPTFSKAQSVNPHTSELLGRCCSLGMLSIRAGFD